MSIPSLKQNTRLGLVTVFGLFALVAEVAEYQFFEHLKSTEKTFVSNNLASIGRLKAGQLAAFLKERRGDSQVLTGLLRVGLVPAWWNANGGDLPATLRQPLESVVAYYDYAGAMILDAKGNIRFRIGRSMSLSETGKSLARRTLTARAPPFSELYAADPTAPERSMLDTFTPIMGADTTTALGVLVLRGDWPSLFTMIHSWPVESRTAETLLISHDSTQVTILTPLRHSTQPALKPHVPIRIGADAPPWPIIKAAHGQSGALESFDYRGQAVLAHILPVQGTPWSMVVKVDAEEALGHLRRLQQMVAAGTLIAVALAGLWVRNRQRQRERANTMREHQRVELRLAAVIDSAMDAIISVNEDQRIVLFNPTAERVFGCAAHEALGQPLDRFILTRFRNAHHEHSRVFGPSDTTARQMGALGTVSGIRADGQEFPIEASLSQTEIDGHTLYTVILRDITERRQAEAVVRDSQRRLQSILDSMFAFVGLCTLDGVLIEANRAPLMAANLRREDVIGKPFWDTYWWNYSSESQEKIREALRRAAEGATVRSDFVVRVADDQFIAIDATFGPLHDEAGRIVQVIGSGVDISDRKRAEEALVHLRRYQDMLFGSVADGLHGLALGGRIIFENPAAERMLGWDKGELLGKPAHPTMHHHRADGTAYPVEQCPIYTTLRDGETRTVFHEVFWRKDGSSFPVEYIVSPVIDDQGARVGAIVAFRDITERLGAEAAQRRNQNFLQAIMDHLPVAIFAKSEPGGTFVLWNKAEERLLGLTSEQVLGKTDYDFFPLEQADFFRQKDREAFEKRTVEYIPDEPIDSPTLGRRSLRTIKVPIFDEHNAPLYALGISEDITERKQADAALQAAQEQVRQMQKMEALSRLAGGIAHDFNNLLTAILGQSELTLMTLTDRDPTLCHDIEEISKAVRRGAALTRQLLTLSRRQPLQPQVLDLARLVDDLAPMLHRVLGEQIAFEVRPDSTGSPIMADSGQLEQVLLNLAINARDAMPQGGRLTLTVTDVTLNEAAIQSHPGLPPGRYARLTVSDTGSGMDEETQRHLFEPFFTTKEKGKGTGLGLATVFGIVTQNGGRIYCSSTPGHGTTFELYFPGTGERAVAPPEPAFAPAELATGTETILLVEDDDAVRLSTLKLLCRAGYTVLDAASPLEALRLAERHPTIPLLLTDVVMPQMHGDELARRVKALRPAIKVIHMSGYTDDARLRDGRLPHGDAFLAKPFTPDALTRTIRTVLDGAPSPHPPAHPT